MKYVIVEILDQTIGFYTENTEESDTTYGCWTTHHPDAKLFDSEAKAELTANTENDKDNRLGKRPNRLAPDLSNRTSWIELVEDVAEFQSRGDTW